MRIVLFLLLLAAPAWGHDGRLTDFKSPSGLGCCGPGACKVVHGVQHVTLPTLGYRWPGGFIPEGQTLPSDDEHFWLCQHGDLITCFFVPVQSY